MTSTLYTARCYLTAATAAMVFIVAGQEYILGIFLAIAMATAWFTCGRVGGSPMPRWTINVLLSLSAIIIIGLAGGSPDVIDFSRLIGTLLVLKLFDRRTPRDDGQLLTLSIFMTIGGVLTDTSLLVGLLVLIFLAVLTPCALRFQVMSGQFGAKADSAKLLHASVGTSRDTQIDRVLSLKHDDARAIRLLAPTLTFGAGLIAIVVFLAIPRGLGERVFGSWGGQKSMIVSGFTDKVELGKAGLISESQRVVFDLKISDSRGESVGGEFEVYYIRGAVLDYYESGRWLRNPTRKVVDTGLQLLPEMGRKSLSPASEVGLLQRYTFRDAADGRGPLFALWRPTSILPSEPIGITYSPLDLHMERHSRGGKLTYEIMSAALPIVVATGKRSPVSFPVDSIRIIAEQVLQERDIPIDPGSRTLAQDGHAIRSLMHYIDETCTYTLDILEPDDPMRDPIEWFLNTGKKGHCEYFASAMAALCKSIGIDARVITGYVATEWNPTTEHYTIRDSHAHAWVEVETVPGGWQHYDPTPPATFAEIHQPTRTTLGRFMKLIDAIEFVWINSVVTFDRPRQEKLLALLGPVPSWLHNLSDNSYNQRTHANGFQRTTPQVNVALVGVGAALVLIGFGGIVGKKLHRVSHSRKHSTLLQDRLQRKQARFFEHLSALLQKQGHLRSTHMPPLQHAESIAESLGSASSDVIDVTRLFYKLRFSAQGLTQEELEKAQSTVRKLQRNWSENQGRSAHSSG